MRVLVIAFDGVMNPSTRLRILQYVPHLEEVGCEVATLFIPYGGTANADELFAAISGADVVFVQRVLNRTLLQALRRAKKPVVYDLDDGIHYIRQSQYQRMQSPTGVRDRLLPRYRAIVRGEKHYSSQRKPLAEMIELASAVVVGNQWLRDDLGLGSDAIVLPTAVWLDGVPVKRHDDHVPTTIGWIGVRSNLLHVEMIRDVLKRLGDRYGDRVELAVVSSAHVAVSSINTRFIRWTLEGESDAVLGFDIGIMPLQNDPFSRAKCAFKAIFCMSRGVPVVASPVGANSDVIRSGSNGYLAATSDEWVTSLAALVEDASLRGRLGAAARMTVEREFAAAVVASQLSHLLLELAADRRAVGVGPRA
jgi:glycosyltransferase involved in cell wall biosynthesis